MYLQRMGTLPAEAERCSVRTSDFDYELPQELIAQYPSEERGGSRLLVLHRESGRIEHRQFSDVAEYLRSGDVLVVNESQVLAARFIGTKRDSGGRVEMFLLRELAPAHWEVLLKPGARIREGMVLSFGDGRLTAEVGPTLTGGKRQVTLAADGDLAAIMSSLGEIPLPPYIGRSPEPSDRVRYQTVYARVQGAVAAPTAGLHFTEQMLTGLRDQGLNVAPVILHVGIGTFRPVKTDDPDDHEMEIERYDLGDSSARMINDARTGGGRIVAVGTTSVRVLESVADESGRVQSGAGETGLYIQPGYSYRAVDVLITNFHLPKSTLLMLVSAFGGHENVMRAYREAVDERYGFYSYGDAMLIL